MHSSIAALVLVLATQAAQGGRPSQPSPQDFSQVGDASTPRRLVATYSDGWSVPRLLTTRGRTWGYKFPRQPNPPMYEGLPLLGLGIDHVVEGDVVVVTVSLQYGSPESRVVEVAKVRLTGTEPARETELERFGVDPIVFSLEAFPLPLLVQPVASSVSPLLDVVVELTRNDLPIYRVTFRNRSQRAVMAVAYHTYRGEVRATDGWRKTNRSTPIIEPGGDYSFTLAAGSGERPGFDRLELSSVLWDDGTVEGDQALKAGEQTLAIGYAQQLRRVLAVLDDALPASGSPTEPKSLAQVRAALASLPIAVDESDPARHLAAQHVQPISSIEYGQVQVKSAALHDLDAYVQAHAGSAEASARAWVTEARPRYSAWLTRAASR
jgi:hypothetical protein